MSSRSEKDQRPNRPPRWRRAIGQIPLSRAIVARMRRGRPPITDPAPPPGFDWRWYVRSYTDLAPAGISDEASAIRHWHSYGRREGRRFAPRRPNSFDWLSYVDRFGANEEAGRPIAMARPPLVCPSIDSIFLRAWGDLVCWDDAGSDHVLQPWDPSVNYADVFRNGPYRAIRESLGEGRLPWPEECSRCLLLRILPEKSGDPWDGTFVRMLRVEPSYYCTLDCPGCVPLAVRRGHAKAFQLDPEILDRIVADLTLRGFAIDALDFQGHGEPLLNPRLWEMARRSRARLPDAWISVTTNAHGRFRDEMARSGFDEVICAIDGVDGLTYAPYRVHGNFELAWRFMADLARAARTVAPNLRVVWKYVLFEHNASPEALRRAQRMASEAGVSELVFVLTRNGSPPRDIRFPSDVPRVEGAPPLSFRFHEPSIEDLEARLVESRRLETDGHPEHAKALSTSVRRNLERFFTSGESLPERHRRLAEALDRLPVHPGGRGLSS